MNKNDEKGSMVIEAAVIMPFFLAFVIAMISFVQIAVADMALQSSVSETTKQVAAHMYPIYLLNHTNAGKDIQSIVDYPALIPEPILEMLGWQAAADELVSLAVNNTILPLLKLYVDDNLIRKNNLSIVDVTLPNLNHKDDAFFGLTAEYKLTLLIPFMSKEIHIRKRSIERVWVGD